MPRTSSVTSSPTTAATFSEAMPSSRPISSTRFAAARGLAAPMLVMIFTPFCLASGSTARMRASSHGL